VHTGWEPVEASVRAIRVAESAWEEGEIEVAVQPDGAFWMDVPAGRYNVRLLLGDSGIRYWYRAAGPGYGSLRPDTLVVDDDRSPVSVDFDLASVHLLLGVSTELDGGSAWVRLHRREVGATPSVWSFPSARIADGTVDVVLPGVLPGMYRVQTLVNVPDYSSGGEWIWVPGVRDSSEAAWFEVSTGGITDVQARFDAPPARIQGEVTGAWQALGLSSGPEVGLVTPDSVAVAGPLPVRADGKFDVKIFLPASVKIYVRHQSVVQWLGGLNFDEATIYELEPGRTISGVDFVESGLRVDIQEPNPGTYDAMFNFYDAGTRELRVQWRSTSTRPALGIPNLRPGVYLVQIVADQPGERSWAPQWFDRAESPDGATPITIANEGDVPRIVVVLDRGGTIAGTIDGPSSGVYGIYLAQADDPARWSSTVVSSGYPSFSFQGLPDGDWKLGAWPYVWGDTPALPPPTIVWYPGTSSWSEAGVLSMRNHEDVTGVVIVFPETPSPGARARP